MNLGMEKKDFNSVRNERILYVVVWAVIAVLPVALELWKLINNSDFAWKFVIRWWVGMVPLIVIFLLHNHILIPKFMKKGRMRMYGFILLIVVTVYGGLRYTADRHMHMAHMGHEMPPIPHFDLKAVPPVRPPHPGMPMPPRPFPFTLLFKIMLVAMTVGTNIAISLAFTYNREQTKRKELENSRLQEELKYLKQQISPHFLMNVLNNIHEMTEENIKEAQDMILELSYLMRYVLYESENDMTTLAAEVRFISSYVALMKRRYVEGLVKVDLELPAQLQDDVHIPPLLFISFIENAFKHGVSYNSECSIDIKLCKESGKVLFSCDNTVPLNKDNGSEGGVGLSNVRRRLDLLYGEDYSLHIDERENSHSVTLIIPCR